MARPVFLESSSLGHIYCVYIVYIMFWPVLYQFIMFFFTLSRADKYSDKLVFTFGPPFARGRHHSRPYLSAGARRFMTWGNFYLLPLIQRSNLIFSLLAYFIFLGQQILLSFGRFYLYIGFSGLFSVGHILDYVIWIAWPNGKPDIWSNSKGVSRGRI